MRDICFGKESFDIDFTSNEEGKSQQEIDYVEEYDGKLHTYEFKWNENAKVRFPKSFIDAYPDSDYHIVTPKNIEDFLLT